jgi:hypothetical protein
MTDTPAPTDFMETLRRLAAIEAHLTADILERASVAYWEQCGSAPRRRGMAAALKAALPDLVRENERLRQLVECKDCMEYAQSATATLRSENERLRECLENIAAIARQGVLCTNEQ